MDLDGASSSSSSECEEIQEAWRKMQKKKKEEEKKERLQKTTKSALENSGAKKLAAVHSWAFSNLAGDRLMQMENKRLFQHTSSTGRQVRSRISATHGRAEELEMHSGDHDDLELDHEPIGAEVTEALSMSLTASEFVSAVATRDSRYDFVFVAVGNDAWLVQKYDAALDLAVAGYECVVRNDDCRSFSCSCDAYISELVTYKGRMGTHPHCVHAYLVGSHSGKAEPYSFPGINPDTATVLPFYGYDSKSCLTLSKQKPARIPFAVFDEPSGSFTIVVHKQPRGGRDTMCCLNHPSKDCECLKAMRSFCIRNHVRPPELGRRNIAQPSTRRVDTLPFRPIMQSNRLYPAIPVPSHHAAYTASLCLSLCLSLSLSLCLSVSLSLSLSRSLSL